MTKIKNNEKQGLKIDMQKVLAPAALVILYILFAIVGNNFFTWDTAENILQSAYYIGFMAFGVTFIIITGGIDLSLGTVMMCSALIGAYSFNAWGLPLGVGVVLTLGIAMAFGLMNGVMIAKLGLPPSLLLWVLRWSPWVSVPSSPRFRLRPGPQLPLRLAAGSRRLWSVPRSLRSSPSALSGCWYSSSSHP